MRNVGAAGAVAAALVLAPALALAQTPVWTVPQPGTTAGGNGSSTIAVTNTFQKVFAASSAAPGAAPGSPGSRHGCTVINQGGNNMWVTEALGVTASTKALAVVLVPNQAYYCNWNGTVLEGEIDITGTAGDGFYAAQY